MFTNLTKLIVYISAGESVLGPTQYCAQSTVQSQGESLCIWRDCMILYYNNVDQVVILFILVYLYCKQNV